MKRLLKIAACLLCFLLVVGFFETGTVSGTMEFVRDLLFFWEEEPPRTDRSTPPTEPSETEPPVYADPGRIGWNLGRCQNLRQSTPVAVFFLDDDTYRWTAEAASEYAANTILPALTRIELQAALYGWDISLPISLFYTGNNHTIAMDGTFPSRLAHREDGTVGIYSNIPAEHRNVFQTLADCLGFEDFFRLDDQLCAQLGAQQVAYLIVSNQHGYCYSLTDTLPDGFQDAEAAILFSRDQNGEPVTSQRVAREVLTLFGAEYFEESPQGRANNLALIRREYPYSLMNLNGYPLETNFVDGFTAYAIGWRDFLPPEFLDLYLDRQEQLWEDPWRPEYNQGTCRNLSGTPYVLSIYINDDESAWDIRLAEHFQNNVVLPALEFLNSEAERWGIGLSLQSGMYNTNLDQGINLRYRGVVRNDSDLRECSDDILDQAALSLGFSSKVHMTRYLQNYTGCQEIIYLVMVNKPGRCYACPDQDDDQGDTTEYALVFGCYWDTQEDCISASVAHEILHLYGAEDMYTEESTGERAGRAQVAQRLFPNDIMHEIYYNIRDNNIDRYTAYAIGWTNQVPQECTTDAFWAEE